MGAYGQKLHNKKNKDSQRSMKKHENNAEDLEMVI